MKRLTIVILILMMNIIASGVSHAQSSPTATPTPTPDWSSVPDGYTCYAPSSSFVYHPQPPSVPERIWRYPVAAWTIGRQGTPYYTGPAYVLTGRGYWGYWSNGVNYSPFWSAPLVYRSAPDHIPAGAVFYIGAGAGGLPAGEYPPGDGAILCFPGGAVTGTATPYPSPTPTPTPTSPPTPTPDLVQTQVSIGQTAVAGGTPPAAWCGYVPTHPCWVAYATQSALEDLMATVAARASNDAPQAVEVVNFPTPVPTSTPEMAQFRETATAALAQPEAVSYTGGSVEFDSGQLGAGAPQFWKVRQYDFGCPIDVGDPWQVRICIRYHHIEQLRVLPEPLPAIDPLVFVGALALLVVRWFIQR